MVHSQTNLFASLTLWLAAATLGACTHQMEHK